MLTSVQPAGGSEAPRFEAFACILVSLGALWLLISHFTLESEALSRLFLLASVGFAIQYFLPPSSRLPFFLALSLIGFAVVLGPLPTAWIVGIGVGLIALCHAPVPFWTRVVLLVAAGVVLALCRAGTVIIPVPAPVWPILASLFMFRLAVYLYDTGHETTRPSMWQSLSYFFLLPNVCFPLFPVVDFKVFRRGFFDSDRNAIHQRGIEWIFRGVVQLLLYRVVYQTLVLDPADVADAADFVQYLIWPFLLYFRVSGQFHIAVGMLRLFGFNLPETHRSYFLAASFTDFWRRINIYWKDFMMKLFYYPSYFALRRRGETVALIASTVIVFVITWTLHSYQWFWLRGAAFFTWNDLIFWSVLGACVVVNGLREWRHGRARPTSATTLDWSQTLALAARTVAMFCFISVLWSLWTTESVRTWLSLWSSATRWPDHVEWPAWIAMSVPVAVGLTVIAKARGWLLPAFGPRAHAVLVTATATCLLVATSFRASAHLGSVGEAAIAWRMGGLNQADAVDLERGYYENLMGVDRFNGELWALYMNRPLEWERGLVESGLAHVVDGTLPYELLPSVEGRFKGAVLRTNRWGMHDKEYDREPPPGCYRIAVLGASHPMGTGVERERTFEALLESKLTSEFRRCFEILNFAVYGYSALEQLHVLTSKVLDFDPDTVLYVGHPEDAGRVSRYLANRVSAGQSLPGDYLHDLVRDAQVSPDLPERTVLQHLAPQAERALTGLYSRINQVAAQRGMCAGFVFMPMIPDMAYPASVVREKQLPKAAGLVMLDLSGVYDVPNRNDLWLSQWDAHPNARGHELIANRLYMLISTDRQLIEGCQGLAVSARRDLRVRGLRGAPPAVHFSAGPATSATSVRLSPSAR